MCGITATIKSSAPAIPDVLRALTVLQNRGYDSVGVGFPGGTDFDIYKAVSGATTHNALSVLSSVDALQSAGAHIAVGHTRWATHGARTEVNAHPHVSADRRVMLVHNGIIENFARLCERLGGKWRCVSETDSEVIANLIAAEYGSDRDAMAALSRATKQMEGTWALVVLFADAPDTVFATRHGSPLVVGIQEHSVTVASEPSAILSRWYEEIQNDDVCVIHREPNCVRVRSLRARTRYVTPLHDITPTCNTERHWTLCEMMDQGASCARAINCGGRLQQCSVKLRGLEEQREALLGVNHLLIVACGTSKFAAAASAHVFRKLAGLHTVQVFDAAEFTADNIPPAQVAVIFVSQSGETRDVAQCIEMVEGVTRIHTLGVVNAVDSLIARRVHSGCYLHAGCERGVASTKAFTSQVVVLNLIAMWLAHQRGVHILSYCDSLRALPATITELLQHARTLVSPLVESLSPHASVFLLGCGCLEAVCHEGALKLKEMAYLHAEGYSGGALKHGPFAVLNSDTPVILLIRGEDSARMLAVHQQVKSRAQPFVISDDAEVVQATGGVQIPFSEKHSEVLFAIALQFVAYGVACNRGIDPDFPRNLAKVVTVT